MGFAERNRSRLLIISKDPTIRNDMIMLLTGCGYFVDYVENRSEGIAKFRNFKHAVVILDVHALPRSPQHLLELFRMYKKNPIILIVAEKNDEARLYPYMQFGIFDIVTVPFQVDYLYFVLRRLIDHSRLTASNEFTKLLLLMIIVTLPIWWVAIWFISRHLQLLP
jgi:two-component system, OmpR family, response regulator ResD